MIQKNYFNFTIQYKNFEILMVNTGQNYHSGYKIIEYDKIKKTKNIKFLKQFQMIERNLL